MNIENLSSPESDQENGLQKRLKILHKARQTKAKRLVRNVVTTDCVCGLHYLILKASKKTGGSSTSATVRTAGYCCLHDLL